MTTGNSFANAILESGECGQYNNFAAIALGLAAYDKTQGNTIKGQLIDPEAAMSYYHGLDRETVKTACRIGSKIKINATCIGIAAHVIARHSPEKAARLLDMLTSNSELAQRTAERLKKVSRQHGEAGSDQMFSIIMQAADLHETGQRTIRFWSTMPLWRVAANDVAPLDRAV